ncbi:M16 family metallopeptidase [Mangrovibacterium lignilyticum]|uniref:M16 family metallopeptidase n=1 Tax=Mangrovibacterium lignilyticum TaxID=2668052 RepID=UPI0013D314DF|nr:insulinase family protein [Mangrovibacterium lignilyticum]
MIKQTKEMFRNFFNKARMVAAMILASIAIVHAQTLDLNQTMPPDSTVTMGKLANGLIYYIKPNSKPEKKVELRLVIKVGSIQENDDQQGLAHFMEHMEFNGTKHFPKNELVDYLQKIGVTFGSDLNANTAWDRTYYILPIPTDVPGALDEGFQILSDWTDGALITDEEVNDERHVILEELRMRNKTANTRMMYKFLPEMFNGSRYAERMPSGLDSIIANCSPDRIREYYNDWYRPNLMAVIAVGDITVPEAKAKIEKYFGHLKNPVNERPRVYYGVEPYQEPKAMVVTDPEATDYSFTLMYPAYEKNIKSTVGYFRENMIRSIFVLSLNKRLNNRTQSATPPFTRAGTSLQGNIGGITLNQGGFQLDVVPLDNLEKAVNAAISELIKAEKYGFTDSDIDPIKNMYFASYENAYKERNKMTSNAYTDQFADNFMEGMPICGVENEYKYLKEVMPTITAKDVSEEAAIWLSNNQNFFTIVTGPADGELSLPSEEGLMKMVKKAFSQKVKRPEERKAALSLLKEQPIPGKILSEEKDSILGMTTYTLSNGLEVTVKPTTFKDNQILFTGVKKGGINLYGTEDKSNLKFLFSVINTMGYGEFSPTELRDYLAGKIAEVGTGMTAYSNTIGGSSSVNDFSMMLELAYLELTSPRKDTDLLQGFITKLKSQLALMKANPQAAFQDTLVKALNHNDPLTPIVVPTEKDIDNIDVDRVLEIYKEQFCNADGFHFFIVGNVDEDSVKPLLEKYIASLPVKGTTPEYKDNGLRAVTGDHVLKFYKGNDDKSVVLDLYHGELPYTEKTALEVSLLSQAMTIQVLENIREKMQAIYSGQATGGLERRPYSHYSIVVQLPCGPENVDTIRTELNREIQEYMKNGVSATDLEKVKKALIEDHKESLKSNGTWAQRLQQIMVWGDLDAKTFLNYEEFVNSVTIEDIKALANKVFTQNNFTAISYPEQAN